MDDRMRALIVEDEPLTCLVVKHYLLKNWTCDMALNGREGVDSFIRACESGLPYDLVCLDVVMPVMNGFDALKAMRNFETIHMFKKRGKILMLSGLSEPTDILRAHMSGSDGYLPKPIYMPLFVYELRRLGLLAS